MLFRSKAMVTVVPAADDLTAVREALRRGGTIVLMKIGKRMSDILGILSEEGVLERAVLVSRAGQAGQRVETDLRALGSEDSRVGYLSVILVHGNDVRAKRRKGGLQ